MRLKSFVVGAVLFVAAASAQAAENSVSIQNRTDWEIHHLFLNLFLSTTNDDTWGPDQLGEHTIARGEQFTLTGIPMDVYDVKLVDEDGDECVVQVVEISSTDTWIITNEDLLRCETAE